MTSKLYVVLDLTKFSLWICTTYGGALSIIRLTQCPNDKLAEIYKGLGLNLNKFASIIEWHRDLVKDLVGETYTLYSAYVEHLRYRAS